MSERDRALCVEFVCDALGISKEELNERLRARNSDCVYLNESGRCWAIKGQCNPCHIKCSYRNKGKEEK